MYVVASTEPFVFGWLRRVPAALVLAWYIAQWLTLVFVVRLVSVFKARIRARFYTRHTVRVALPVKLLISDF